MPLNPHPSRQPQLACSSQTIRAGARERDRALELTTLRGLLRVGRCLLFKGCGPEARPSIDMPMDRVVALSFPPFNCTYMYIATAPSLSTQDNGATLTLSMRARPTTHRCAGAVRRAGGLQQSAQLRVQSAEPPRAHETPRGGRVAYRRTSRAMGWAHVPHTAGAGNVRVRSLPLRGG